jgi:hypothetical protein
MGMVLLFLLFANSIMCGQSSATKQKILVGLNKIEVNKVAYIGVIKTIYFNNDNKKDYIIVATDSERRSGNTYILLSTKQHNTYDVYASDDGLTTFSSAGIDKNQIIKVKNNTFLWEYGERFFTDPSYTVYYYCSYFKYINNQITCYKSSIRELYGKIKVNNVILPNNGGFRLLGKTVII